MTLPIFIPKEIIYTLLTNDSQLATMVGSRIYDNIAPNVAVEPYIVFNRQSENPLITLDHVLALTRYEYLVKAVTKGSSYAPLKQIVERFDTVLDKYKGEIASGYIDIIERIATIEYPELDSNGVQYMHLGALYSIEVRSK